MYWHRFLSIYNLKVPAITEVVTNYLDGIYYGEVKKLKGRFTEEAYFYGDIKGTEYLKSIDEYLEGVKNRQSPSKLNETNRMEIIGLTLIRQKR